MKLKLGDRPVSRMTRPILITSNAGATFATRVSLYDRIFGGLVALLLLGMFLFLTLFSVWWFGAPQVGRHIIICPPPTPNPNLLLPMTDDELNVVEFDGSESQAFTESLEMSEVSVAELAKSKLSDSDGTGIGVFGSGDGLGIGFGRVAGPPAGTGPPKWNVVQEAANLEDYQRKLDFFAIEIGAVHKSNNEILKIAQLSTEKIVTKSSRSAESKRRYFANQRTRLLQWDHQTIAQAGVDSQDVIAVHFYPAHLIVKMQQLIDARYKDKASDLEEVTFQIVGTPGDFRFEIKEVKLND